jgi:hypothetical protein
VKVLTVENADAYKRFIEHFFNFALDIHYQLGIIIKAFLFSDQSDQKIEQKFAQYLEM